MWRHLLAIVAIVALAILPASSWASGTSSTTATFTMPQGADPEHSLTFLEAGVPYSMTNDAAPVVIVGQTLIDGLELHSAIGAPTSSFLPAVQVNLFTPDYHDPILFTALSSPGVIDPGTGLPFVPWKVVGTGPLVQFVMQPGSAPLSVGDFFAGIDVPSPGEGFASSHFTLTAYTTFQPLVTPEPGPLAVGAALAGALVLYGWRLRRSLARAR